MRSASSRADVRRDKREPEKDLERRAAEVGTSRAAGRAPDQEMGELREGFRLEA